MTVVLMAAVSKSSLRSSLRQKNETVSDKLIVTSPTVGKPLPPSPLLGKRTRTVSSTAQHNYTSSKRQKFENQHKPRQKLVVGNHVPQKIASDVGLRRVVTGDRSLDLPKATSAVQPPSNGTIIANNISRIESVNGELHLSTRNETNGAKVKGVSDADKRTLRSQDGGSRSKSELSLYFPNYEEFINNEPKEVGKQTCLSESQRLQFYSNTTAFTEALTTETRLFITEDPPKSPIATETFIHPSPTKTHHSERRSSLVTVGSGPPPLSALVTQKIDFGPILATLPPSDGDPFDASIFQKAHRRAERQEKQLRNIEKERAQHEKVQLERLLEGLRGPDWLKVMGVSGITEGDRKLWEGKRAWCMREVGALIEKFRLWREEERRRKVEKEMSVRDEESEEEEEEDDENDSRSRSLASIDADDLPARQLHAEALSASSSRSKHKSKYKSRSKPRPAASHSLASLSLSTTATFTKPFTSFFSKKHQRTAALEKHRRSGRTRFAFGHPVPDIQQKDFHLPRDMITEEARRASARSRRRQRRNTKTE